MIIFSIIVIIRIISSIPLCCALGSINAPFTMTVSDLSSDDVAEGLLQWHGLVSCWVAVLFSLKQATLVQVKHYK